MKKILLSLFMLMNASGSFATVLTLSNMSYSPGQYTTFSAAHDAASDFDTIYVHGSSINYGSISIYKRLVIIGTGHNPDKQNPLVSAFLQITLGSSNVQLIGLVIQNVSSYGFTNCTIKKCRIIGQSSGESLFLAYADNWLIEGNIIEAPSYYVPLFFYGTSSNNTIIQNNIIINSGSEKIVGIRNDPTQRTYILNNVFIGQYSNQRTFYDIWYTNIDNNIFYTSMPDGNYSYFNNCTMNNNISFGSDDNAFYQPGANNVIGDPLFNNYPGYEAMYDYNWDLSLAPTSPGHNSGTDGTDRGVFGGLGFKFTETGEPSIAEITAFTITSPTIIAPGGTLTISVTSKRVH